MAPIGPLLYTVFTSILEVFLLCLAGYILAHKGILDKKTQKQLNRLNVSLFTPALLFSKVAFFLSPAKLAELWTIPIFFVIVTLVSMFIAYVLGTIFRLRRSQRNFAMAAAMFMNSNSLPIALMQSLVVTVGGMKWGHDDNKNAMLGRALSYLVLYSTLGMVLRWSYGVKLLAESDEEVVGSDPEEIDERTPLLSSETENGGGSDTTAPTVVGNSTDGLRPPIVRKRTKFYNSFPNSPNASRMDLAHTEPPTAVHSRFATAAHSQSETSSDEEGPSQPASGLPVTSPGLRSRSHSYAQPKVSTSTRIKKRATKILHGFNDFMTVPLWAALASIIVACVPRLQHTLEVHLFPIKGALASAGNCSIPVTLVVLGAYFYTPKDTENAPEPVHNHSSANRSTVSLMKSVRAMFQKDAATTHKRAPLSRPGETRTVVIAIITRMILTPLALMPLMALAAKYDWHAVFEDPVFIVSNVLLVSSPPALTLAQITQAASGDAFERLISRTIFWSYCIVTPPATIIYVMIGLLLAKLQ